MKPFILVLLFFLFCCSCTTHTTNCTNEALTFRLIGFSKADVDTVIFTEEYPSTGLPASNAVVFIAANYDSTSGVFQHDTINIPQGFLADTLNVHLNFPSLKRNIFITKIVSEHPHSNSFKSLFFVSYKLDGCYNRILSYQLDGKEIQVNKYNNGYQLVDIIK